MLYIPFPYKRCSRCGDYFPPTLRYFARHKATRDRLGSHCRKCTRAAARRWRNEHRSHISEYNRKHYQANIEAIRAKDRRYRQQYPERRHEAERKWRLANPDKKRASKRRWYAANPDKNRAMRQRTYQKHKSESRERGHRWQQKNPDKVYRIVKRYRQAHPDKMREFNQSRRTKRYTLPFSFSSDDWIRCLDYWHHCCAYCGKQRGFFAATKLSADHFIPISAPDCPGTIPANMLPACQSCNSSKNASDPAEWLPKHFGKRKAKRILEAVQVYFEWVTSRSK